MDFRNVFIFTLVVYGCCSTRALEDQLQENPKCVPQLDVDCIYDVVQELDFKTLLSMADANQFYSDLCDPIFKRKYSNREIIIDNFAFFITPPNGKPKSTTTRVSVTEESIHFEGIHLFLKTLRHFGNAIPKLQINLYNGSTVESKGLIQYVQKFCGDSLSNLSINVGRGNIFQHISKPFKNVEHVFIRSALPSPKKQSIPIEQMFPKMRSLSLDTMKANNNFLTTHFPHLEHLQLKVSHYGYEVKYADGLLEKNPQIRSLEVVNPDVPNFLGKISSMPQLEHLILNLTWHHYIRNEFRFESVTKLTFGADNIDQPQYLIFPKLQEFELYFHDSRPKAWLAFMETHRYIKYFHLHFHYLEDKHFSRLTSILRNLEEMFVYRGDVESIDVETFMEFIDDHRQLRKFHLNECNEIDKVILQSRYSNEWTINEHHNGLTLERK